MPILYKLFIKKLYLLSLMSLPIAMCYKQEKYYCPHFRDSKIWVEKIR